MANENDMKIIPIRLLIIGAPGKIATCNVVFISATSYNRYCCTVVCLEKQTLTWVSYFYLFGLKVSIKYKIVA